MAKMFYSLEEAAAKLGKSEAQVRGMAESGQLQEFRDRDRLMFKVEQVDLIAGDDGVIPLAESGELEPLFTLLRQAQQDLQVYQKDTSTLIGSSH